MDGDRVYVAGGAGMLLCLDVETGAVVWQHDTVAEYDTTVPVWGTASSPLVEDDLLIAIVGGEPDALVVAFDKRTGEEVWRAIDVVTEMGYAQPDHLRGGRRAPAHRLAPERGQLAESGDR